MVNRNARLPAQKKGRPETPLRKDEHGGMREILLRRTENMNRFVWVARESAKM